MPLHEMHQGQGSSEQFHAPSPSELARRQPHMFNLVGAEIVAYVAYHFTSQRR